MDINKTTPGRRALILGGGGATGNAWLIGVIAGLSDAGLDVTEADLIIGTSAGSTAAAQITGAPAAQLFAGIMNAIPEQQIPPAHPVGRPVPDKPVTNHMETTAAILDAAGDAADMRCKMGAWALAKEASSDPSAQAWWRNTVARRLSSRDWPKQRMLIPAVDAHSGIPVVFDSHGGVELVDAVAASCAGGFAYQIGPRQYIDGGYRADLNADLAAGYERVLVIPPLGDRTRKQLAWGLHLAAQVAKLQALGTWVESILPDGNSQDALGVGMNLMDLSARRSSAQAGYQQGRALAGQLTGFWH